MYMTVFVCSTSEVLMLIAVWQLVHAGVHAHAHAWLCDNAGVLAVLVNKYKLEKYNVSLIPSTTTFAPNLMYLQHIMKVVLKQCL